MDQDSNFIKWPGPWLDEELTDQERVDCIKLMDCLHEIGLRGNFPLHPPDSDDPSIVTAEFAAVIGDLAPFLNSFMHMVYSLTKSGALDSWLLKDPVGSTTSIIASILEGYTNEQQPQLFEEQTSLFSRYEDSNRLKGEVLNALPRLQSLIPQKHLIPNNKLTNALGADIIGVGKVAISVSKPKAKQPIDIICNLNYEGEKVKLAGRQNFTEYDRNVYNAVTSLFVFGDQSHIVTPAMVYRAMVGMGETENPSPQQIGAVTRSLDKIRFIRAVVDCTEEFKQRRISLNGEYVTNGIIDTYLLNASAIQIQAGGRAVRAYKIDKTPVLYAYSRALNQVYTVPAALLDIRAVDSKTGKATTSRICNTESRIQVKGYLLRRIEGMKGKNALKNDVISLLSCDKEGKHHAGLYEIAGDATPSRIVAKRVRDYAEDVLKFWKAKKYISSYCFTKSGQQTTGIKITL